ncbi:MAG: thiamine-phosphate kinase [Candidatus Eremiobacteraeota bacterium]|nr:thiamine-phosphate kinase [Candidatus Eremiobacteraeota bacterium]
MNEDELVRALREIVEHNPGKKPLLGIGDDAAGWRPSRSHVSVISCDALIEGVHFTMEMPAVDIGHRAMAANLSDIAAMGARPVLATIALGIPAHVSTDTILEIYRGMAALAGSSQTTIVGGDIVTAPVLVLSITIVGEVRATHLKRRSGARPGDILAVTGPLGASRAGLELSASPTALNGELRTQALQAHRHPIPRLREGAWLAASAYVHAMMDISDGLSTDLARLCAQSACGAVIEDVPIAPCARAVAEFRGEDPAIYALAGGEDFELAVAVQPRAFGYLAGRYRKHFGADLIAVGRFNSGKGVLTRDGDEKRELAATGWDHLKR